VGRELFAQAAEDENGLLGMTTVFGDRSATNLALLRPEVHDQAQEGRFPERWA